jgi:RNA polymerase-binding protein DksA
MALTRRQIIELASAMRERRELLLEEIERGVAQARADSREALAGEVPDSGDEAQADLIGELDLASVRRDLGELEELDAAGRRLAEGRYGICLDCGADIPLERLRAQPGAPRCVDCQRQRERTYRA